MSTSSYSDVINHNGTVGYCEAELLQVPYIERIKYINYINSMQIVKFVT